MKERDKQQETPSMQRQRMQNLTLCGVFAAMITLMTAYVCHIPWGSNGGYLHLGDALIYLAAALLPRPYALLAAMVGAGLADLMTAPLWILPSVMVKGCLVCLFTYRKKQILCSRNLIAAVLAIGVTVGGYYLAERVLFGTYAALFSMVGNLVQGVGSMLLFFVAGKALDKAGWKRR
jgi:uncharacterized repeat protein (TIGR04002 family)